VVQKLLGNLELGVSNNLQPILQITCIASGSDESLSLSGDKADPSAVVDKFAENTKLLVGLRVMLYKRGGHPQTAPGTASAHHRIEAAAAGGAGETLSSTRAG
jgi:hypothetical protein